jgi:hypothetical protein
VVTDPSKRVCLTSNSLPVLFRNVHVAAQVLELPDEG